MSVPAEMLHRIARVVMGIQRAIEHGHYDTHPDYITLLKHTNDEIYLTPGDRTQRQERVKEALRRAGGDYLGDGASLIADFEASVSWLAS